MNQEKICLKEFGNTRISKGCQFVFPALCFLECSSCITGFFITPCIYYDLKEIANHISFLSQTKVDLKGDQLCFDYRNKTLKSGWSRKVLVCYSWFSEIMMLFREEFSALD